MFKCKICGKEFEKQASCAAHTKIHYHIKKKKKITPYQGMGEGWSKKSAQDLLEGNHKFKSFDLKTRLIDYGILEDKCIICGFNEKRNGAKYSVCHLDHIDGDNTNNIINNLRLLCPNHHALTETYCVRKQWANQYTKRDVG